MKLRFSNPFRKHFAKATVRERFLIFLLAMVAFVIWLQSCLQQTNRLCENWEKMKMKEKKQEVWLQNGPHVQKNLTKIISKMDPAKTFSASALEEAVENAIRSHPFPHSIDTPQTKRNAMFDKHTLQLHCENATIEDLIEFEKNISLQSPYLSLDKIQLHPNEKDPKLLEAECSISAFKLKENSL